MEYFNSKKLNISIAICALIFGILFYLIPILVNKHRTNLILDYATKCAVLTLTEGNGRGFIQRKSCQVYGLGNEEKVFYDNLKMNKIETERFDSENVLVTLTFFKKDGVTAYIADKIQQPNNPVFVFYANQNVWASGKTEKEALQNINF